MPGTHLLPPNLLKLFAPRPPLNYARPLDRDIDRVHAKKVDGVAALLSRLKEEKEDATVAQGAEQGSNAPEMEEGEEPTFTLAEEVKREMRREERKRAKQEKFKVLKDSCTFPTFSH
jgi:U1 small nuclear ribonucleoprotein 70kDa